MPSRRSPYSKFRAEMIFDSAIHAVIGWCERHGIQVQHQSLPPEKAGEFTGTQVVMNRDFDAEQRLYYFTHAIGSIILWSRNPNTTQKMFHELRDAKESRETSPTRLEHAIVAYRAFETASSELAVQLLSDCEYSSLVPSYTNFMRADLQAMTMFHKTGHAPAWESFFKSWNDAVAAGHKQIEPFVPKPIPHFEPVEFEKQEILQR